MQIPDQPFVVGKADWAASTFRRLIANGEIRRLAWGVYVASGTPDSIELRAKALQLVMPPRAVVCRSTAAWLYDLDVLRAPADELRVRLELAVTEGTAAIRRPDVSCFVELLDEHDVQTVDGIRATTELRTTADLGRWLPRYHAIGALDSALRLDLVTQAQLTEEAERWFGFKGVRQLRELIRFADPRAESARESWLRLFVHDAGFPEATPQVPIDRGWGLEPYRLDLGIEELRFGLEYDGREFHSARDHAHDEQRRAFIRGVGWTLIVVRRGDLERPQRLVDAIGSFVTPVRAPRRGMGVTTGFAGRAAA